MRGEQEFRAVLGGASLCLALALGHAAPANGQEDSWHVSVGGGVVNAPKFPGSDSQSTHALPFVSANYGRFFIGGPGAGTVGGIGVILHRDSHWRLSTAISGGLARRRESDDPRLTGLGDVKRTVSGGLGASYAYDWFIARASVASDIAGNKQGTLARLDVRGRYRPDDRWTFSAGPGLTWANDRYMQTFFGVDAEQHAARPDLPQFDAKGGIERTRFSASAYYRIDRRWGLGMFVSVARLQNDAAASPITEDRSQHFVGAFVTYRFGNAPGLQDAGAETRWGTY
jgi:MipA family protein